MNLKNIENSLIRGICETFGNSPSVHFFVIKRGCYSGKSWFNVKMNFKDAVRASRPWTIRFVGRIYILTTGPLQRELIFECTSWEYSSTGNCNETRSSSFFTFSNFVIWHQVKKSSIQLYLSFDWLTCSCLKHFHSVTFNLNQNCTFIRVYSAAFRKLVNIFLIEQHFS